MNTDVTVCRKESILGDTVLPLFFGEEKLVVPLMSLLVLWEIFPEAMGNDSGKLSGYMPYF